MNPPLFSLFGLAGVLEVVGGVLLVIGLFTRPVAFILAGQMAVAYFMAHAPQSFPPSSTTARRPSCSASSSSTWWPRAPAPGASTTTASPRPEFRLRRGGALSLRRCRNACHPRTLSGMTSSVPSTRRQPPDRRRQGPGSTRPQFGGWPKRRTPRKKSWRGSSTGWTTE